MNRIKEKAPCPTATGQDAEQDNGYKDCITGMLKTINNGRSLQRIYNLVYYFYVKDDE